MTDRSRRGSRGGGGERIEVVKPRQQRSVNSTGRLVDAATELFAELGYASTTLALVGERAGYSRGIVTTRFGNKENLAWVVVARAARPWQTVLDARELADNGLDQILALIDVSRDNMVEQPAARLVLERLYAEAGAPLAPLHGRFQQNLRELVEVVSDMCRRGVVDGSIRTDVDAQEVAGLLVAQLRGIGYQWFLFPDLVEPAAYHRLLADQIREWLAAPTASAH